MARDVLSLAIGGGVGGFVSSLVIGLRQFPPEVALLTAVIIAVVAAGVAGGLGATVNALRGDG